ncbi:MAG TPA: metalloregulator ArsR/SmtB family transcription factor [Candidatus Limnocylindrales bacterium]|nr:metalloregulator ArsR/SmtB family transcription factor [Candidatus Limnocylindrales bacterium]
MAIELPAPQRTDNQASGIDSRDSDYERTAVVGRALADPKRLCVLESLAVGELSVSELAGRVACQVPNMSQHLAVLRAAGLVSTRREGSTVFYRLADPRVLEAYALLQSIAR